MQPYAPGGAHAGPKPGRMQMGGQKGDMMKREILAWLGAAATVLAAGLAGYLLALVTPAW